MREPTSGVRLAVLPGEGARLVVIFEGSPSAYRVMDTAAQLARLLNDHIASLVRSFPTRFVGLGTLPMQDPELAIGELERKLASIAAALGRN